MQQFVELHRAQRRGGCSDDLPCQRNQAALETSAFRGKPDMQLAAIVPVADAPDQPLRLHRFYCDQGRRLGGTDTLRQLALRQPVLMPERAQKVPGARGNSEWLDLDLKITLQGAVSGAHLT